jgi:hypothetical protein
MKVFKKIMSKNKHLDAYCPFPKHSMYQRDFIDWGKGVKLVERRPELP